MSTNATYPNGREPQRLRWTPELVERFWSGIAKTRLAEYNFGRTGGKPFVLAIEHVLTKAGRILDFGAGEGEIVELLMERGFQVAAYEPVAARREVFERKFLAHPNFLGVMGPQDHQTYDVVLMIEVIEHILDESFDESLARVAALTRLGGHIVVSTPNNEDLELSMAYCPMSNMLFNRWQHVRSFTQDSLTALMARYGYECRAVHAMEYQAHFFVPFDPVWGGPDYKREIPDYLRRMRAHQPTQIGNQSRLLYIGTKRK